MQLPAPRTATPDRPSWHPAFMATNKEAFPHADPVARFVVVMSAVRGDLHNVLHLVGAANAKDSPEFFYFVRLAMGHLVEGAASLKSYRDTFPEVEDLLRKLPPDGQKALRKAANAGSQVGGKALPHSRNRTFHYPSPEPKYNTDQELAQTLDALGDSEAKFERELTPPHRRRLSTADKTMLAMAMGKHNPERAALYKQVEKTRDGAVAFVNFVTRLEEKYRSERGISL